MPETTLADQARAICNSAGIPLDAQERILQEIQDAGTITAGATRTFIIRRLSVRGMLETDRRFAPGVNLILGDNFAGKSSILDILKSCLTGNKDAIDPQILPLLESAAVEFTLDDARYTIVRDYVGRTSGVFEGSLETHLAGQSKPVVTKLADIKSFWLDRLGYPPITKLQTKAGNVDKQTKLVGFGDYFRAFYQDQDRGYSELFSRESFETRQHVFNVMIGAANAPLSNRARIKAGQLRNQIAIDGHSMNAFREFLMAKVRTATGTEHIEKGLQQIKQSAAKALTEWTGARDNLNKLPLQASDDGADSDVAIYQELQKALALQADNAQRLREQEQRAREIGDRIAALQAQAAASVVLQSYYPIVCPRCVQAIPQDWADKESQAGECRVCHRHAPSDVDGREQAEAALADAGEEMAELQESMEKTRVAGETIAAKVQDLQEARRKLVTENRGVIEHALVKASDTLATTHEKATKLATLATEIDSDTEYLAQMTRKTEANRMEVDIWNQIEELALHQEQSSDFGNPYEVFARNVASFLDKLKKAHRGPPELDPKGLLSIGG
ncbi:MAG: AAA family ATPase, partial [Thermoplasmatota archaeon]